MENNRPDKDIMREQYEDSLFKLLMDDFAEKEGQRLTEENETLKDDKDFVLPDGIEARGEKTINEIFVAKRRKESWQRTKRILSGVAAIVLVCGIVFATLFTTVSAFRESVYKLLVDDEHINTDINLQETNVTNELGNSIEVPQGTYLPTWLPEGYALVSYETDAAKTIAMFSNNSGNTIYYYEFNNETVFGVDTEDAESTESISFNGHDGLVVLKGDKISITWIDTRRNMLVRIKTLDIDKKIVIKIAQSVNEY